METVYHGSAGQRHLQDGGRVDQEVKYVHVRENTSNEVPWVCKARGVQ